MRYTSFPTLTFIAFVTASYCSEAQACRRIELLTTRTIRRTCSFPLSTFTRSFDSSDISRWAQITRGGSSNITTSYERDQKVPSLFQSESDLIFDHYAACLAATEGLRRIRDQTIQSQLQQNQQNDKNNGCHSKRNMKQAKEWAIAVYAESASKVIEGMGMPVSEFNAIGRIVSKDAELKQKILEQAYLYRLQSTVQLDQVPEVKTQSKTFQPISNDKFRNFCQSMYEIENLRRQQADDLKQSFNVEQLPSLTKDPRLSPLLDTTVRNAIQQFPITASKIVHRFGLNNDEFNELLQRTRSSVFFRWKVLRNIGSIERQQSEK